MSSKRTWAACLAALFATLWPAIAAAACPASGTFVIAPLNIVDVVSGEIRSGRALEIADGIIVSERAWAGPETGANDPGWIDGQDLYAIPGLVDAHVHTVWAPGVPDAFFPGFLEYGITAVRDMGGDLAVLSDTRQRLRNCELVGPHLIAPGLFLDGPEPVDADMSFAIGTDEEAVSAVRDLASHDVDFLKVYSMLGRDELRTLLDAADATGFAVSGHLPADVDPAGNLAARFQTIEHMAIEIGGLCRGAEPTDCLNRLGWLMANDVALTPTIIVRQVSTDMARTDFSAPEPVGPAIVAAFWNGQRQRAIAGASPEWFERRDESLREIDRLTQIYQRLGGILLAGSDAGNPFILPGPGLHDELRNLVDAGLSPRDALAAATINAAFLFRHERIGRLAPGYRADFVLLTRNPLDDISATREIRAVYLNGVRVDD